MPKPKAEEYEPGWHKTHSELDVAAKVTEKVPGAQSAQKDAPTLLEYLPPAHAMHQELSQSDSTSE